jgi:hypothetical protein
VTFLHSPSVVVVKVDNGLHVLHVEVVLHLAKVANYHPRNPHLFKLAHHLFPNMHIHPPLS